ncbi:MAG: TonB-dependent receptor [Candidatus Riflebacteria bacterium]|nr:TonB-dependent receptor [Candidatus Riflebacteria bacterium]
MRGVINDRRPVVLYFLLVICFLGSPTVFSAADSSKGFQKAMELASLDFDKLLSMEVKTVSTGSRHEESLAESPTAVSVVTAREIKMHGWRTLTEILRTLPGMYATTTGGYDLVGIRGFSRPGDYNSRLLLVDGVPINESIFGTGPTGREFPIDVSLIDRVEVVRGPSFSLYGSNAFFGVVNVITKKPGKDATTEIQGNVGSDFKAENRMTWSGEANHGALMISGSVYNTPGPRNQYYKEFDSPLTNNGVAEETDSERSQQGFTKYQNDRLMLEAVWGKRRRGLGAAPWGVVFNDQRNIVDDVYTYWNMQYRMPCSDGSNLNLRFIQERYDYIGRYVYDISAAGDLSNLLVNEDNMEHASREYEGDWSKKIGRHQLVLGIDLKDIYRQNLENRDISLKLFEHGSQHSNAFYIQDEFKLSSHLSINVAERLEWKEGFGIHTSPRFGLVWLPDEKQSIKLVSGRSMNFPSAEQRYYQDGGLTQKVNPNIGPETNDLSELSYEIELNKLTSACLTWYRYNLRDLIELQSDPTDGLMVFQNTSNLSAHGVELGLIHHWEDGSRGRLSWCWQHAGYVDGPPRTLVNSPSHHGQIELEKPIPRLHLDCGIEGIFTGPRQTQTSSLPMQSQVNLWLTKKVEKRAVELSLGVDNLFGNRNFDPTSVDFRQDNLPLPGRTFRLQAVYRFK